MKTLYTAEVTAIGARNGHIESSDGLLDLDLAIPTSMGGDGKRKGTNPEQLFAGGYAACFGGALAFVAGKKKIATGEVTVKANVAIGPNDAGVFQLAVVLDVTVPELGKEEAQKLVEEAHQVCPYSNATRGNIEVTLVVHGNG
jgi:osmotically inducible protein OsmC